MSGAVTITSDQHVGINHRLNLSGHVMKPDQFPVSQV